MGRYTDAPENNLLGLTEKAVLNEQKAPGVARGERPRLQNSTASKRPLAGVEQELPERGPLGRPAAPLVAVLLIDDAARPLGKGAQLKKLVVIGPCCGSRRGYRERRSSYRASLKVRVIQDQRVRHLTQWDAGRNR
jgi:hypothetical protein